MYTTKAIFAVILALVMVAIPLAITEQADAAGDDYDKLTFVVDGQGYETLSAAIDSIQTSGTVTVQVSEEGTGTADAAGAMIPEGKDVTLDLNGCTVALTKTITVQGTLTIEDSSLQDGYVPQVSDDYKTVSYVAGELTNVNSSKTDAVTITINNGGHVIHNSGMISSATNYTVAVYGNNSVSIDGTITSVLDVYGGYQVGTEGGPGLFGDGATLNVYDGVIVGTGNSAIAGNGTVSDTMDNSGTVINIYDGTFIGLMADSFRDSGYSANVIYQPQNGLLNIYGGTFFADRGTVIVVRAGQVNIEGGEFISTGIDGDAHDGTGYVGDSKYSVQPATVVYELASDYSGLEGDISNEVNISGGTFTSDDSISTIQLIRNPENLEMDVDINISGGVFSSDASDFVIEGYKQVGSIVGPISTEGAIDSDNTSVTVDSNTDAVIIPVDGDVSNATVSATVTVSDGSKVSMVYQGGLTTVGLAMSASQVTVENFPNVSTDNLLTVYELNVTGGITQGSFDLTVTIDVDIPDGMVLSSAWVVYYGDNDVTESYRATVDGSSVTFTTNHTSTYAFYGEFVEEQTPLPPVWDDDDDYVPPVYVPEQDSGSDDTVTIVACAAAAVVAAIMAVFLIVERKH